MAVKKKKTIPFKFGQKHMDYIYACQFNTYNILEGAVRSGKTIDNVYAFAHELKTCPDKIHLATGSTMANAKLNIGDANGFGLEYIFRGQCRWSKYKDKEFNELPLGFAFSDKQFDEMMGKWGLDPEKDLDKIYRIPGGGFIQKKDHKHFHEVLDRHNAEMEAAKAADEDGTGFLYQMFKYELDNHEYGYTGELEDTLDCLGLTWEELKASPVMLKALDKASTEIREREGC